MTRNKKTLIFFLLTLFFGFVRLVQAVNMESDHYQIQWGNINIGSGKPDNENYSLGITMGQIAPGLYSASGYKVRAGFQYIQTIIPFSFTISDVAINLGSLIAQSPSTDANTLTVRAGGAGGYQVLAYENHPLKIHQGAEIPDTLCDNGNCTEASAEVWSQNTTYGFGFNINGNDTPSDFVDTTYFRQFANDEDNEIHQTVMEKTGVTSQSQATVTYKVNISGSQEAGQYETGIVYIAIPTY